MFIYALCVKMKNLVVTISCVCVTGLWDTSRFSCRTWRCVWSRRRLDFLGEQHFQHLESSRRKWLQLQPTRWRICVTLVELCLIWNYVNVDVKDYVNVDDIMWMSNYEDTMCGRCWNYMLMSKPCCNVFVNVSWCLRIGMWMWIDVCECKCECVVVYEICVYMKSMYFCKCEMKK
jgi:hypothetical protein